MVSITLILIGLIVGYLVGILIKSYSFGLIWDIIAGVLGALSGGYIFNSLGIYPGRGWSGIILVGIFGAILFIVILRLIRWIMKKL